MSINSTKLSKSARNKIQSWSDQPSSAHYNIFPCEILPSLCSSLTTSNLSEIMKNVHVFLIKAANSLMSSHPGLPTNNVWWIDSNSSSQEGMSSDTRMEHWCIQSSICHYSLYTLWFVRHPIFKLESILMTIIIIESNQQRSDIVEKCTSGDWHHYL